MQIAKIGHARFDDLNAAFIAAARTDVPALVARVRDLEAERDAYARSHAILRAIHGALTDALPNTPIPALDSFDVVEMVRGLATECERMKTFAAENFSQMIRQEAEQMRAYGLSYEGVRQVLREHDDGEISFGKLMDLLRAAARMMAEDEARERRAKATDGFEEPGANVVTAGDLIGLRRKE